MRWTFLTNHARALLCIAEDPQVRLRVIAQQIGITERAAQSLVNDLVDAGYVWLVTRLDPAAEAGAERREVMSDRQVLRGLADVAIASPWFAFAPFYRRRHLRWGATDAEVAGAMPGAPEHPGRLPAFLRHRHRLHRRR